MADILRRGRLDPTNEEVEKYTYFMDMRIFSANINIDIAHTIMLKEQNIIKEEDCKKIITALLQIEKLPPSEDIHIAIESRLIEMIGEDIGGRMHSGRSRNDVVATCIRMVLREELAQLSIELINLRVALLIIATDNIKTIMPGFTHLQHAQPTTLAHHLCAHEAALSRDYERIQDAYLRVNQCPLGAAAFASTGFNLNRERTQELLGFSNLLENSMDAVSSRDFLIECASVFVNLMVNLSKMAEEIVLWSTSEFNFIELDDAYTSTSSIMPQKKNPDTAELMRGKTGKVAGTLMSLITICKGLPLSYNRDLQEANVWESVDIVRASVRIMRGMMETMVFHTDILALQSNVGFTTATELADTFVRQTGIPFRTAHNIVGQLAKEGFTMAKIDEISKSVLGETLSSKGLTEEMVLEALNPVTNINRRTIIGGTAPEEMQRYIEKRDHTIKYEKRIFSALVHSLHAGAKLLTDAVLEIVGDE